MPLHHPFFKKTDPDASEPKKMPSEPTDEMLQAYRTRGWLMPLCGLLTALVFCLAIPVWYGFGKGFIPWLSLIIGVFLSVLAIPFHLLGGSRALFFFTSRKKHPLLYGFSIVLNALGSSLCMTAYYVHVNMAPTSSVLYAAIILPAALYALTALIMQVIPHRYALITGLIALVTLALLITSVVFWIKNDNKLFFSFVFFNLLWTLISVIALHVACADETSPCLRFASFASFGILIGVAAIVLVILACAGGDCDCDCSDGECCCDCADCGIGGNGEKTARRKRRKIK